jgi:hypothetical protein
MVIPILGIYPKECKLGYNRGICTLMFTSAEFSNSNPDVLQLMNGLRKCGVYIYIEQVFNSRTTIWDLGEEGKKGRETDGESTILTYVTSMQVEDIRICIESC